MVERATVVDRGDDLSSLAVRNIHFNVVDEYRRLIRFDGIFDQGREQIRANFETAVGEDFVGRGSYDLRFFSTEDGWNLTTVEFPDDDLASMAVAARDASIRRGFSGRREQFEAYGAQMLKDYLLDAPNGAQIVWTSPPGSVEQGYRWQTSMTYFAQVEGDDLVDRRIRISYAMSELSLDGHAALFSEFSESDDFVVDPNFFISNMIDVSDVAAIACPEDVFGRVDALIDGGMRNPDAELRAHMDELVFVACSDQIRESTRFLQSMFEYVYRRRGNQLSQVDVDELEVAYEMAYKAVRQFGNNRALCSSQVMMDDFLRRKQVLYRSADSASLYGLSHEDREEAMMLQAYLDRRYGIEPMLVGGLGCPGGMTLGLGVFESDLLIEMQAGPFMNLPSVLHASEGGEDRMRCVTCPFCKEKVDAILTATTIRCPACNESAPRS